MFLVKGPALSHVHRAGFRPEENSLWVFEKPEGVDCGNFQGWYHREVEVMPIYSPD